MSAFQPRLQLPNPSLNTQYDQEDTNLIVHSPKTEDEEDVNIELDDEAEDGGYPITEEVILIDDQYYKNLQERHTTSDTLNMSKRTPIGAKEQIDIMAEDLKRSIERLNKVIEKSAGYQQHHHIQQRQ